MAATSASSSMSSRNRKASVSQTQRDSLLQSPDQTATTPTDGSPTITRSPQEWSQYANKLTRNLSRQASSQTQASPKSPPESATISRSDTGTSSTVASERTSDEASRPSKPGRKKSGFSSFVTSLVGANKKPMISAPTNPVHVTHIGYDTSTGSFTVSPC